MIKSKYAYIRVTIVVPDPTGKDVEIIGGLAIQSHENVYEMYKSLKQEMEKWLTSRTDEDDLSIAEAYEDFVLRLWPGRSYFVEVGRTLGDYVQVFQPDKDDWLSHDTLSCS